MTARMPTPSYSGGSLRYVGPAQEEPDSEAESPCPHPPGSVEKVYMLQQRAEQGQALWHPEDVVVPLDSEPTFLKLFLDEGEEMFLVGDEYDEMEGK